MPSLTDFRQRTASELGNFVASTAAASSTNGKLIDSTFPVYSTIPQDDLYRDTYLLRPNAAASDQIRVVSLYVPSSGELDVDHIWTAAPTAGEAYELHAVIAPDKLLTLLNQALLRCLIVREVSFTPIAGQNRHNLTNLGLSWITKQSWVRAAGYLAANELRDQVDPYLRAIRGQVVTDGVNMFLEHPWTTFSGNETIYLRTTCPAYNLCAPQSAPTSYGTQNGLALAGDACPAAVDWVAAATLVEAFRQYGHLLEPTANQRLIRDQGGAAAWFSDLTSKNYREPMLEIRPLSRFGPSGRTWGPLGWS